MPTTTILSKIIIEYIMRRFTFNMPLLGTANNQEMFQYFLLKITAQSALISVLPSFGHPSEYRDSLLIDLHIDGAVKHKKLAISLKGTAKKLESSTKSEFLYRIAFDNPIPGWFFFQKMQSPQASSQNILDMIKDSLLIKEGIQVYLKHLTPYFSRILAMSTSDFSIFKKLILMDMRKEIQKNVADLYQIYQTQAHLQPIESDFYHSLDLELLRDSCKSEIDSILLKLSCGTTEDAMAILMDRAESFSKRSYQTYLESINALECRLYRNYNTILLAYSHFIQDQLTNNSLALRTN